MTDWAVTHDLKAGRLRRRHLRLVLTGVPDETRPKQVRHALEAAGCASAYSEGGVAWANHSLVRYNGEEAYLVTGRIEKWTWDELTARAGGQRAITLKLTPSDYSLIRLAASSAGQSLTGWCLDALLAYIPRLEMDGRVTYVPELGRVDERRE